LRYSRCPHPLACAIDRAGEKTMRFKSFALLMSLLSTAALVPQAAQALEPEKAFTEARTVIFSEIVNELNRLAPSKPGRTQISEEGSLMRGKFTAGEFAQYFGDLTVSFAADNELGYVELQCSVSVDVDRKALAKRPPGDVVLEDGVDSDHVPFQIIARPKVNCVVRSRS
jgi:hypothetical protein